MQLGSEGLASSPVGTRGQLRWSCLVCRHARDSQGSQDVGGRASRRKGNVHRVGISHSESVVEFACCESVKNVRKVLVGAKEDEGKWEFVAFEKKN